MAGKVFEIEISGKTYEIEAPDQESALDAARKMTGASPRSDGYARDPSMGSDGMSGDAIRAANAGDTRAKMPAADIASAYDFAQERGDRKEQQAMARAYVDRERQDSPITTGVGDRVRAFARGVPVVGSYLDEMNAATMHPFDAKKREKALDYERARDKQYDDQNPYESFGVQLAGGIAGGGAAAPALSGAVQGASRLGSLIRGAGTGVALGAVDGFGRGEETLANRGESAAFGGLIGGAVGAAAPVVASGIGNVSNRIFQRVADKADKTGLDKTARDVLSRVLANDGALGPEGAAAIAKAGPNAMLADVSPGAVSLLDTALQRGGKGAINARNAIESRAAQAGGQVDEALTRALGAPQGATTAEEAIRTGTKAARGNAYDAAFARPIDYSAPEARSIEELLKRVPGSAVSQANAELKMLGHNSKQILADIADDGSVVFKQLPDVQQIDAITRNLQAIARQGDGKGALGGNTPAGRAAGNLAGEIRDNLRTLVPEYGQALDTAADAIGRRNALDFGARVLSPSTARDELASELRGMSQAERASVAQGVRSKIDETLANVRSVISDPNVDARQAVAALNQFSSKAAQEKIAMIAGPEQAAALNASLDEARRALSLRAGVSQNSKTFARQAASQAVDDMSAPGVLGTFIAPAEKGGVSAGVRNVVRALAGESPEVAAARSDAVYGDILKALTAPRGSDASELALRLGRRAQADQGAQDVSAILARLISSGAAGGGYQAIEHSRRTPQ